MANQREVIGKLKSCHTKADKFTTYTTSYITSY